VTFCSGPLALDAALRYQSTMQILAFKTSGEISQGTVATRSKCGRILNEDL